MDANRPDGDYDIIGLGMPCDRLEVFAYTA